LSLREAGCTVAGVRGIYAALALPVACALVGGVDRGALARSADCVPLPSSDQGSFRRADSKSVRLELGSCTFRLATAGQVAYEGEYTVTNGTASSGRMLVSHDRGCVGEENYPASYDYVFARGAALLELQLADIDDFCSGRAEQLSARFLRVIDGDVFVGLRRTPSASTFRARGAIVDSGRFAALGALAHAVLRLQGTKGSLVLRTAIVGSALTWSVRSGSGAYEDVRGGGKMRVVSARLRLVLTGRVTNT
jgi:hypothetical protein